MGVIVDHIGIGQAARDILVDGKTHLAGRECAGDGVAVGQLLVDIDEVTGEDDAFVGAEESPVAGLVGIVNLLVYQHERAFAVDDDIRKALKRLGFGIDERFLGFFGPVFVTLQVSQQGFVMVGRCDSFLP